MRSVDEGLGVHSADYPPQDVMERRAISSSGFSSSRALREAAADGNGTGSTNGGLGDNSVTGSTKNELGENIATGSANNELGGSRPDTSKSRIPSQHSRARLARTPVPGADQLSSDGEDEDEEDDGIDGTSDVLITELKEDEAALLGLISRHIPPVEESVPPEPEPVDVIDDDMQWDTDLEIEGICESLIQIKIFPSVIRKTNQVINMMPNFSMKDNFKRTRNLINCASRLRGHFCDINKLSLASI